MTHSTNGGPRLLTHMDFSEMSEMTGKPKKIVAGRLELEILGSEFYCLTETKTESALWASRSEFVELAKRILEYEDEDKYDINRNAVIDFQRER